MERVSQLYHSGFSLKNICSHIVFISESSFCVWNCFLINKQSKQAEQKENHRYGEHWDGSQWGGRAGGMRGKVKELRNRNV